MVAEHIDWALQQLNDRNTPRPLPILAHSGARRLPE
jgi:hypothetical protein